MFSGFRFSCIVSNLGEMGNLKIGVGVSYIDICKYCDTVGKDYPLNVDKSLSQRLHQSMNTNTKVTYPKDTRRNNNVIITLQRHRYIVLT